MSGPQISSRFITANQSSGGSIADTYADKLQHDSFSPVHFAQACEEVGFFYLVNHGIEESLIADVFAQSKKFFELPLEEKLTVELDNNNRGYTAFEGESLDPANQSRGDTKEGYYIGAEISSDDPRAAKPLHGPNQWPFAGTTAISPTYHSYCQVCWGADVVPGWREVMMAYHSEAIRLTLKLADILALALDLPLDYFQRPGFFDNPIVSLRPLHYAAVESKPEEGVFGAGAHSDYGVFTYLVTDQVGGLQICRHKNKQPRVWEAVEAREG